MTLGFSLRAVRRPAGPAHARAIAQAWGAWVTARGSAAGPPEGCRWVGVGQGATRAAGSWLARDEAAAD